MIKSIIGGVCAATLLSGLAHAATRTLNIGWVVNPTETGCRAELELIARSGAVTPVSLHSDGRVLSLKFFKSDLPSRAFLPIRVDRERYSNLMVRGSDGSGELLISQQTEAAMKHGAVLDIAWLSDEPMSASLIGSEEGLVDLKVCGAQVAAEYRDQLANQQAAQERVEAQARAKALSEAQLRAVTAQAAAAEAQRRQLDEATAIQRRAEASRQERAYRGATRQRTWVERRGGYLPPYEYDTGSRWSPPPRPAWPPPREYDRY